MWQNRPLFTDPAIQADVWQNGYAAHDLMSGEEAARLLEELHTHADRLGIRFEPSSDYLPECYLPDHEDSEEFRQIVADVLIAANVDRLKRLLPDYRIVHATLFAKPPGAGVLPLHSDFHLQADPGVTTITAWCALTPAKADTGAMQFVAGSHQLMPNPVVCGLAPPHSTAIDDLTRLLTTEELHPGQALLFDTSILHGSTANASTQTRVAALFGLIPQKSTGAYHIASPDCPGKVNVVRAERAERLRSRADQMYSGVAQTNVIGEYTYKGTVFSKEEFMAVLKNASAIRDGKISFDDVSAAVDEGLTVAPSLAEPMKQVFADPCDQSAFNDRGFVKKRLLSREKAAEFHAKVLALTPDDEYDPDKGGVGPTYHMTELDTNIAYKQELRKLTEEYFGDLIDTVFKDYRILTTTLFVKPPGSGRAPQHTDWNVQEDNSWPTMFIWCALSDVGDENGPLRLLQGSHGVLDIVHSAGGKPSYADTQATLEQHFEPVTVDAGECILFDAGMLHESHDNQSDEPRFALRIACIPRHRRGVMFGEVEDAPGYFDIHSMEGEDIMQHTGAELVRGQLKTEKLRRIYAPQEALVGEEILALVDNGARIRAGEATMESVLRDYRASRAASTLTAQTDSGRTGMSMLRRIKRAVHSRLAKFAVLN